MTTVKRRLLWICLVLSLLLPSGCAAGHPLAERDGQAAGTSVPPVDRRMTNRDQVVLCLRNGLRERSAAVTVTFSDIHDVSGELDDLTGSWMEEALAETRHPAEGDYIRYQYGGYRYRFSCDKEPGEESLPETYHYSIRIEPSYYSYLAWEEQVDRYVAERLAAFSFRPGTPAVEKIKAIYDDLCRTVTYDKVHAKNPHATIRHTAYAAFFLHTATCQGYCTALYRMLREAGISCRIITGEAENETLHAWLIVEADGAWYLLDPTWDAKSKDGYRFFMIGTEEDAGRHVPGERFRSEAFQRAYPMSEASLF